MTGQQQPSDRELTLVPGWERALGALIIDITRAQTEDAIFSSLAPGLLQIVPADRASVALLTADGLELELTGIAGLGGVLGSLGRRLTRRGSALDATLAAGGVLEWQTASSSFNEAPELHAAGIRHCVNVRLDTATGPIGTLNVGCARGERCAPEALDTIRHLGALTMASVERVRLLQAATADLERERRNTHRLNVLYEVGEALQPAMREDEIVETVAAALPRVLETDEIVYARLAESGDRLEVRIVERAAGGLADGLALPVTGSGMGRAFQTRRLQVFERLAPALADHRELLENGFTSAVSIPLVAHGETAGVLTVASRQPMQCWADIQYFLTALGRLVSASLERAREQARRKQVEAGLSRTRRLESLGVLAGGLAHDFNNLLAGVLGNASLALADLPPGSPARYAVEQIEDAAQRAADLTSQLLSYSGRHQLQRERVDLGAFVRGLGRDMADAVNGAATLSLDLPSEPVHAAIDTGFVREAILNLVVNAGESLAGSECGTVRVSAFAPEVDALPTADAAGKPVTLGPCAAIRVEDTGRGMDEAVAARAFEPFYSTKFAGRGLGLPGTAGIARSHGGMVTMTSTPGVGTSVTVYLPLADQEADSAPGEPSALDTWQRHVVLVVDDNDAVVSLAARILDREGFDVLAATDGITALKLFAEHGERLAAVVLDVTMPGMSGDELFRELLDHGLRAPVIVSSGFAETEALATFRAEAVSGFLHKPYRARELVAQVHRAVGTPAARAV